MTKTKKIKLLTIQKILALAALSFSTSCALSINSGLKVGNNGGGGDLGDGGSGGGGSPAVSLEGTLSCVESPLAHSTGNVCTFEIISMSGLSGATLSYELDASSSCLSINLSSSTGNATFTAPAKDTNCVVKVKIKNGSSLITTITSNTVSPVNNPPTADAQSVEVELNTATSITLAGADLDADNLSFVVVSAPSNGSLSGSAPNLTYTPNNNYRGNDSFTFKVNDGSVDSAPATVSLSVGALRVSINQAREQADLARALPVVFNVVFNMAINTATFTVDDIVQNGTASGLVWTIFNLGDNKNFRLMATHQQGMEGGAPPSPGGTIIPTLPANKVMAGLTGPSNLASTSVDNNVTWDTSTALPASGLSWEVVSESNQRSLRAVWTKSTSTGVQSQKIQLYQDGVCGVAMGAEVSLNASDELYNYTATSDGTYSYRVITVLAGSKLTASGCSAPIVVQENACTQTEINATPYAGSGTENDPYLICTAAQMQAIGAAAQRMAGHWSGKYFKLMNNISLSAYTGAAFNIIGDNSTNFSGHFDGNNRIISNFSYSNTGKDYVGIFGYISNATIKNLGLSKVSVEGRNNVGGLVGYVDNSTITNSYATGSVSGSNYIGGLVGYMRNNSTITNSYATGSVSGSNNYVGGLVGYMWSGTITNSYATGSVSGSILVGGLVGGMSNNSTITNSYATGSVSGSGDYVGGLVGLMWNNSTITNSYATGSVSGSNNYVGGLVGDVYYSTITNSYATGSVSGSSLTGGLVGVMWSNSAITNSYATGSVSGSNNYVGGLVGYMEYNSSITNSYATGSVSGSNNYVGGLVGYMEYNSSITNSYATGSVSGSSLTGGLVGYVDESTITNSFWDTQTTGQTSSGGQGDGQAMGRTTNEMQTPATFTSVGWNTSIWLFQQGHYPVHR